jgi:hypothetical protein
MTCNGQRDILGVWAGAGGEGAKHWLHVLTELKNRGVHDVPMVVCDGLTGLPDAIAAVWPDNPAWHMRWPCGCPNSSCSDGVRRARRMIWIDRALIAALPDYYPLLGLRVTPATILRSHRRRLPAAGRRGEPGPAGHAQAARKRPRMGGGVTSSQ